MLYRQNQIKIGGFGSPFSHDVSSCTGYPPDKFTWIFNEIPASGICVFMDYDVLGGTRVSAPHKFLWLCESRAVTWKAHQFVANNYEMLGNAYKAIFTHDLELISKSPLFKFVPPASNYTWVKDTRMREKNTLLSMISSGKNTTPGHQIRNRVMDWIKSQYPKAALYGRNFRPFEKKEDVLADVMFSVAMENDSYECYYTEKLLDCFALRVIPIYNGPRSVDRWFEPKGIVWIPQNGSLDLLDYLDQDYYKSLKWEIESNYCAAIEHLRADDYLFGEINAIL